MSLHRVAPGLSESLSAKERIAVLQDIVKTAESEFQKGYFSLAEWFERYDALHLLAYCCAYFVCHHPDVDPEANGEIEFYPHYLEILQAFSLMRERSLSAKPLGPDAQELLDLMNSIGEAASIRGFKPNANRREGENERNHVLLNMRIQTMAVRNPGYPHHIRQIAIELAERIRDDFIDVHAIDPVKLVDSLFHLKEVVLERLEEHFGRISHAFRETSYRKVASAYVKSFPGVQDFDADRLFSFSGRDLDSFKAVLLYYSDMMLGDCFVFTADDLLDVYGKCADREVVRNLIERLSFEFGDLRDYNKEWVLLNNPVWERPFIKLDDDAYFLALVGHIPHYISGLLEGLVRDDPVLEKKYRAKKAKYLEDEVERLFRAGFPDGKFYRGSMWDDGQGDKGENDLTMVIGSVAIVVEAKSGSLSAPAQRGAPKRFANTVRDLIVAPAEQASRFIRILEKTQGPNSFVTRSGSENKIDVSNVRYFLPLTVTMEQFGLVSNMLDLAESGFTDRKISELPQVVSLTDLMVIFEILDLQSEKVHYFFRRRELGARVELHGYEMDILAFYLDRGFNVDEVEFSEDCSIGLVSASKRLDPYFVGEQLGIAADKPGLRLTQWWARILQRLDTGISEDRLDAALVLLNVPYDDQKKLERQFTKLSRRVGRNGGEEPRTWVELLTVPSERQFCVALYPYFSAFREKRDTVIDDFLQQDNAHQSRGAVCIGVNLDDGDAPYSVVVVASQPNLFDRL